MCILVKVSFSTRLLSHSCLHGTPRPFLMEPCKAKSSSDALVGISVVCPNHSLLLHLKYAMAQMKLRSCIRHVVGFLWYTFFTARDLFLTSSAKCIAAINGAVI